MKRKKLLSVTFLALALHFFTDKASSQLVFSVNGGAGGTIVDIEAWENYPANSISNWNTFTSQFDLQAFLLETNDFQFGFEAGYQYLFWYEVNTVYGYALREVYAYNLMGIVRKAFNNKFFTEAGAGVFFFDGFSDFAISAAIGYNIEINENIALPLKINAGVILEEVTPVLPVGISAGVSYRL